MNLTTLSGGRRFWDRFAPWYERWLNRGNYHRAIITEINSFIEPGWEVIDIGAGTGVLSIPMASVGCSVTAIEPSEGMRSIFSEKLRSLNVRNVHICPERWEDFHHNTTLNPDLIIACNSLHLTEGGIIGGMSKVFSFKSKYVCLATEINQSIFIDFKEVDSIQDEYDFLYIKNLSLDSSFIFEDPEEARELSVLTGIDIEVSLEGEKLVQRDRTDLAVIWWERR